MKKNKNYIPLLFFASVFVGFAAILGAMFISQNTFADKVYGAGGTTSTQDYKARAYVNRVQNPTYNEISSMGITDATIYHVYGENTDVDATEDIWDGGGNYTYTADATADAVSIASSSASDSTPDTVTIVGLDYAGDLTTQTASINGTTRVALTTALWRVISMQWNGTTANVGNIAVYTGTSTIPSQGDTKIRGFILAGNNKTEMGLFTCPNDYVCFMKSAETGISRKGDSGTEIDMNLLIKEYGYPVKELKPRLNIGQSGLSTYNYDFPYLYVLPGKSDVRYRVQALDASTDNLGIYSVIEIMAIDEKYFDSTYLTNIGQP